MASISSNIQMSYLSSGTWKSFSGKTQNAMDGLKLQTASGSTYYLQYRTFNQGQSDYYPYVASNINDFAGSSGKPVQRVQIQAYKADGTKLTSGIVVMYRAYTDGAWLPWVSNADPEWMRSVQSKYNLGGTLDTAGSYAGKAGQNIGGIEIQVFEEGSLGNFTGGEVKASMSYMYGTTTASWDTFDSSIISGTIQGLKIQTDSSKDYYLQYRTWNEGRTDYYPYVKSNVNDYAGSFGKKVQRLQIQAYKNDGTKLTSGVIVMYRAYVGAKWLPWVSNADPEWMRNVQTKYNLGGTLDTAGSYAGKEGEQIWGIEVRIFEEDSMNAGSGSFTGGEVNLTLSHMAGSTSNWTGFTKSATASQMDGIKIQTPSSEPFYLMYKTWNEGRTDYYPEVSSRVNDYAGSAGKPIQRLSIRAYDNSGNKLVSGVVVMYRAIVEGRWLPWVSNADPDWMQSVQSQYNLDGILDTSSSYAGIAGKNISGIEIRCFTGSTTSLPSGSLSGSEVSASMSYLVDSTWNSFNRSVTASHIDGIKIQTSTGKPYYLQYRTWNAGKSSFYPEVKSTQNDFAGSGGLPIQLLNIRVYDNNGIKLTTGVVVMYRALVDGRWLPWVSNADPEWMRAAQAKYSLGGTLDTAAYYAGISGKNIGGVEIRIFEENTASIAPPTPSGNAKIIPVTHICQLPEFPTGCESVSTVMAINHIGKYAGFYMTVDKFVSSYLDKTDIGIPFDPNLSFGGDPRSQYGSYGCYAPVIKKALDKAASGTGHYAKITNDLSLSLLCSLYIDNDIPVILWATMNMRTPYISTSWKFDGRTIKWIAPEHCLLLIGYDDNNYIFNDPLKAQGQTYYRKADVEAAYNGLGKQAVVILKDVPVSSVEINHSTLNVAVGETAQLLAKVLPENAKNPTISWSSDNTSVASVTSYGLVTAKWPGTANITATAGGKTATCRVTTYELPPRGTSPSAFDFIPVIRELEDELAEMWHYTDVLFINPRDIVNLLRSLAYNGYEWVVATGWTSNEATLNRIKDRNPSLWNRLEPHIRIDDSRKMLSDNARGIIDLAHMAATIESYIGDGIAPKFWSGWGGDLATGMASTTRRIADKNNYEEFRNKSNRQIAFMTIGDGTERAGGSACNYSDFCSDFDGYKIAQMLNKEYNDAMINIGNGEPNNHIFSDVLRQYYFQTPNLFTKRFTWIEEEVGVSVNDPNRFSNKIKEMMTTIKVPAYGSVIDIKGDYTYKENNKTIKIPPTEGTIQDCCDAFAYYIYTMTH